MNVIRKLGEALIVWLLNLFNFGIAAEKYTQLGTPSRKNRGKKGSYRIRDRIQSGNSAEITTSALENSPEETSVLLIDGGERHLGQLFYNPPRSMISHIPVEITARIVATQFGQLHDRAMLVKGMTGDIEEKNITTTAAMLVELYGLRDSFSVHSLVPAQQQWLDTKRLFAEWSWEVTALKTGVHKLTLRVTCLVSTGAGLIPSGDIEPIVSTIAVRVNAQRRIGIIAAAVALMIAGAVIPWLLETYVGPALKGFTEPAASPEVDKTG